MTDLLVPPAPAAAPASVDPATGLHSALYEGVLGHRRLTPVVHAFRYRVLMAYLDLAELPDALPPATRGLPVRFRREDYHGEPSLPLDVAVRDTIEDRTGRRPSGPIRMLAHLRTWGWAFNPIAWYFAFDEADARVETVLAEVTNTPWHERHAYVLEPPATPGAPVRFPKELHVSPFMDLDLDHALAWTEPGRDRVHLRMTDHRADDLVFEADLDLERRPLTHRSMARLLARHVVPTHRVSAGIYWQALKLQLKGAPFRRHPIKHPSGCPAANTNHGPVGSHHPGRTP